MNIYDLKDEDVTGSIQTILNNNNNNIEYNIEPTCIF